MVATGGVVPPAIVFVILPADVFVHAADEVMVDLTDILTIFESTDPHKA